MLFPSRMGVCVRHGGDSIARQSQTKADAGREAQSPEPVEAAMSNRRRLDGMQKCGSEQREP